MLTAFLPQIALRDISLSPQLNTEPSWPSSFPHADPADTEPAHPLHEMLLLKSLLQESELVSGQDINSKANVKPGFQSPRRHAGLMDQKKTYTCLPRGLRHPLCASLNPKINPEAEPGVGEAPLG